jgi:hypothetical protein
MKPSLFDAGRYEEIDARLARLEPTANARFGTMSPSAMVCHLIDALEIALGIAPTEPRRGWLPKPLVRWLVIHVVPWPKGKAKTVPEMLRTQPTNWEADTAKLRSLLKNAAKRGPAEPWSPDPAFGRVSGRDYGYFLYKHFDHHLQQFGV